MGRLCYLASKVEESQLKAKHLVGKSGRYGRMVCRGVCVGGLVFLHKRRPQRSNQMRQLVPPDNHFTTT